MNINNENNNINEYMLNIICSNKIDLLSVIVEQLLLQLVKLHQLNIYHGDINPSNIMLNIKQFETNENNININTDGYVLINTNNINHINTYVKVTFIDFGLSNNITYSKDYNIFHSTDGYASLSALIKNYYVGLIYNNKDNNDISSIYIEKNKQLNFDCKKSDLWALGTTLFELIYNKEYVNYYNVNINDSKENIIMEYINKICDKKISHNVLLKNSNYIQANKIKQYRKLRDITNLLLINDINNCNISLNYDDKIQSINISHINNNMNDYDYCISKIFKILGYNKECLNNNNITKLSIIENDIMTYDNIIQIINSFYCDVFLNNNYNCSSKKFKKTINNIYKYYDMT